MKTIVITGETAEGKTTSLMIAMKDVIYNSPNSNLKWLGVLLVVPTKQRADQFRRLHLTNDHWGGNVKVVGVSELPKYLVGNNYNGIFFDDYHEFPPCPEGDPLIIAAQRNPNVIGLTKLQSATLKVWKSTSVWYKPWTWGTGYFTAIIL